MNLSRATNEDRVVQQTISNWVNFALPLEHHPCSKTANWFMKYILFLLLIMGALRFTLIALKTAKKTTGRQTFNRIIVMPKNINFRISGIGASLLLTDDYHDYSTDFPQTWKAFLEIIRLAQKIARVNRINELNMMSLLHLCLRCFPSFLICYFYVSTKKVNNSNCVSTTVLTYSVLYWNFVLEIFRFRRSCFVCHGNFGCQNIEFWPDFNRLYVLHEDMIPFFSQRWDFGQIKIRSYHERNPVEHSKSVLLVVLPKETYDLKPSIAFFKELGFDIYSRLNARFDYPRVISDVENDVVVVSERSIKSWLYRVKPRFVCATHQTTILIEAMRIGYSPIFLGTQSELAEKVKRDNAIMDLTPHLLNFPGDCNKIKELAQTLNSKPILNNSEK